MQSKNITDNNRLIAVVYFCINYDVGISKKYLLIIKFKNLRKLIV